MLVHRRWHWLASIQHRAVLYAGGNVSTEYTLTPPSAGYMLGQHWQTSIQNWVVHHA